MFRCQDLVSNSFQQCLTLLAVAQHHIPQKDHAVCTNCQTGEHLIDDSRSFQYKTSFSCVGQRFLKEELVEREGCLIESRNLWGVIPPSTGEA